MGDGGANGPSAEVRAESGGERRRALWLLLAVAVLALGAAGAGGAFLGRGGEQVALAQVAPQAVGVIDPNTNTIVASIPVGRRPAAIAVGSGRVWVANADDRTVAVIDPATREVVRTIGVGGEPAALAVDGNTVWVAGFRGRRGFVLIRIDAESYATQVVAHGDLGFYPLPKPFVDIGIAAGRTWVAAGSALIGFADGRIRRLRAESISGLVADRNRLWAVDQARQKLYRLDPLRGTPVEETSMQQLGLAPRYLAVGSGALWTILTGGDATSNDRLARIDLGAQEVTQTMPIGSASAGGRAPADVATGFGSVWVTRGADATVARIDPPTGTVAATVELGNSPGAVAVGEGYVWVTVY